MRTSSIVKEMPEAPATLEKMEEEEEEVGLITVMEYMMAVSDEVMRLDILD